MNIFTLWCFDYESDLIIINPKDIFPEDALLSIKTTPLFFLNLSGGMGKFSLVYFLLDHVRLYQVLGSPARLWHHLFNFKNKWWGGDSVLDRLQPKLN